MTTGGIIYVLAVITNTSKAISLGVDAIFILGLTFIVVKLTESINKNISEIINLAGWSLSAKTLVGIIQLAMSGMGKISSFIDKLTFWN